MPAADKCIVTAGYALPVLGCQGQAVIISCFACCTCGTEEVLAFHGAEVVVFVVAS